MGRRDRRRIILEYSGRDLINTEAEAEALAECVMTNTSFDEVFVFIGAEKKALADCLEEIEERLEGAISMCYDLTDDAGINAGFAGEIRSAWRILRAIEKGVRRL